MLFRLETGFLPHLVDPIGAGIISRIGEFLGIRVTRCRVVKIFTVDGLHQKDIEFLLSEGVWHDPVLQVAAVGCLPCSEPLPDWFCEVGFRPGVTDNEGRTARETASVALNIDKNSFVVYTSTQYRFTEDSKHPLSEEDINRVCRDFLCNELIQQYRIKNYADWKKDNGFDPIVAKVINEASDKVNIINLTAMNDSELENLSRQNTWALNLAEMRCATTYFSDTFEAQNRAKHGLPPNPTDVEMEAIAQTWSEHCKHKIFASRIDYLDADTGKHKFTDNLYKSCIRDTTQIIRQQAGINDYCHSVFKDNAGVIAFINGYDACIKVETHNSPSALDPYGGALTGIVGVNRDPLGTGMGADLVCNMDVFCFASPFYDKALPPRVLHPRRILEGVRQGVEHGGNKSGIPTVNGSLVFDPRYLGKPLVFCGTVGLIPATICGHPGYEKAAKIDDIIVMAGGRIGKDGIHGATFSSEELHEGSPATAVQIGDPITQRKLYDFILCARDACLYNSITDNGAGGLSSSVGEMAEDTNGCVIDLDKAPLKYAGLLPWEILLSEAQERMTFAVPPEKLDAFLKLAKKMDVEAVALGHFTNSGYFIARYKGHVVAFLKMDFLHHGSPQLNLKAVWQKPHHNDIHIEGQSADRNWNNEFLKTMLRRLNICSKETIIRQYDHEVRGGSVIKPLVGIMRDGPSDAAVIRPLIESDAGLVLAHGICPKFSDYDTYWMTANAMDEAIRNAVAVGANPDSLAGVDNFCWCDPIQSETNPDGYYKLAQLVRACQALRHFSLSYRLPCISGKDSMKNDYLNNKERISIPPTLLFSVLGVIENVIRTQTSDFKKPGDYIYILGGTWREMAGSEAATQLGIHDGKIPIVDASSAMKRYRVLYKSICKRLITSCHDCSDGGIAVAIAEMCIGGRLGCKIDLEKIITFEKMSTFELMYSESASRHIVTVSPDSVFQFENLCSGVAFARIGITSEEARMQFKIKNSDIVDIEVEELATAFKSVF